MKAVNWIVLAVVMVMTTWFILRTQDKQERKEYLLDINWKFTSGDPENAYMAVYDDNDWDYVNLPHDWMIRLRPNENNPSGTAGGFYPGGIGWYRRTMDLSNYDHLKQFYLVFDGVQANSEVWFNGEYLGKKEYGYASFYYDLSELVRTDSFNVIAVRTDCSKMPMDRWYSGGGIFRNVTLIACNEIHVPVWGESAQSQIDSLGNANLDISLAIKNAHRKAKRFDIRYDVVDARGKLVAEGKSTEHLDGNSSDTCHKSFEIKDPALWSPENPQLYTVHCYLMDQSKQLDHVSVKHGFRSAEFNAEKGFLLNGEKVMLKGVNLHHDGGELGSAVPIEVWKRRLSILKKLGVNALRLAHNPHAPEVLDLCDEMGFLVIDELYDKWEMPWENSAVDYNLEESWEEEVELFIRRDMNHPSVILWSVGNETVEQFDDPESGIEWYQRLIAKVRSIDSGRHVTAAMRPGRPELNVELPSSLMFESPVVSYNYKSDSFRIWHKKYPELIFIASETKAYGTEVVEDYQHIDYSDNSWNDMDEFVAGQFIWAGIDYLGEAPGWPYRGFDKGLLETNGFIKPHAWYIASRYRTDPMVKITVKDSLEAAEMNKNTNWQRSWAGSPLADHWTFHHDPAPKELVIFTNCERVNIELNQEILHSLDRADFSDGVIKATVPYQPGKLVAHAFYMDERGKMKEVSDTLTTSYNAWALAMQPDRREVNSENRIVHITTTVVDSLGELNPHSSHLVTYELDGPGEIMVIDNGDLADQTPYESNQKRVRKGKQLLILQAGSEPGDLIVSASAEGLRPSRVKIKSKD